MNKKNNRRTLDRMHIPDSSVYYKPDTQMYIFNRYIGPEELIDISKSGAGFEISHDLSKNDYITLKIIMALLLICIILLEDDLKMVWGLNILLTLVNVIESIPIFGLIHW